MKPLFALFLIIAISSGIAISATDLCPVCHGAVVEVTKQKDDLSKPSKNMDVWNRSSCGNPFSGDGSYICMKDGYAFVVSLNTWNLSLSDRDGFALPLAKSIRSFPLPSKSKYPDNAVYSQEFKSLKSVTHALQLWCLKDPQYFKTIKAYAKRNELSLTIRNMERNGRYKGEWIVRIEKKTEQDKMRR
jgi:hypothetical protein